MCLYPLQAIVTHCNVQWLDVAYFLQMLWSIGVSTLNYLPLLLSRLAPRPERVETMCPFVSV